MPDSRTPLCPSCCASDNNPYTNANGRKMRACNRCMIQWEEFPDAMTTERAAQSPQPATDWKRIHQDANGFQWVRRYEAEAKLEYASAVNAAPNQLRATIECLLQCKSECLEQILWLRAERDRLQEALFKRFYTRAGSDGNCALCGHFVAFGKIKDKSSHHEECAALGDPPQGCPEKINPTGS